MALAACLPTELAEAAPFCRFDGPAVLVGVEGVVTPGREDELQIGRAVLLLLREGW